MVGVFVTFRFATGFDAKRLQEVAERVQAKFVGMEGLRSKAFTVNPERQEATNFYIWESESAARAFFTPALLNQVMGLYGVAPTVDFVSVAALVDNGMRGPGSART
jgi:hypothetical protein